MTRSATHAHNAGAVGIGDASGVAGASGIAGSRDRRVSHDAGRLGIRERAAMLALMAAGGELPNPELKERYGIDVSGEVRRRLNHRHLVSTRRDGRRNLHELTDKGWKWCADELTAATPARAGSAGGALYAVLGGLRRFLAAADLRLADVFGAAASEAPATIDTGPGSATTAITAAAAATSATAGTAAATGTGTGTGTEERVRVAYRRLTDRAGGWVSLTALRGWLADLPRERLDETLRGMVRGGRANLVPRADQHLLSAADRAAALPIGAESAHLLSIEDA